MPPRRAKPAKQNVMAATEPAKEEEATAEAPAAVGGQSPSVAHEAEAALDTETSTATFSVETFQMVPFEHMENLNKKVQMQMETRGAEKVDETAKQEVVAVSESVKEEEAPAEVASPTVNSEVVQQFVAELLSFVHHRTSAKKP